MPDKETLLEIKHFKRATAHARDKSLITEQVKVGSATFQFLERMESRRRQQECMLTLDMRGKVPDECKRYVHKNRTFWLDDESHRIFTEGLEENNLVFTVGTFEDIIDGDHTFKGMRKAGIRQPETDTAGPSTNTAETEVDRYIKPAGSPEVIPLGYYNKRTEERLQYSTTALVTGGTYSVHFKTKNISVHGLLLASQEHIPFKPGEQVRVTCSEICEEYAAPLVRIAYTVVKIFQASNEYRLALRLNTESAPEAVAFLRGFIDEQLQQAKGKRKLDHEDARLTTYSQIIELYYSLSTSAIPFFIGTAATDGYAISVICKNHNNASLLDMLRDHQQSYVFAGFQNHKRIEQLIALMQDDGQNDPLLAIYLDKKTGQPGVIGDFEFKDQRAWLCFVQQKLMDEQIRVFKVLLRPQAKIRSEKLDNKLDRLQAKSPDLAENLLSDIRRIIALGVLVDITAQIEPQAKKAIHGTNQKTLQAAAETVQRGAEVTISAQPRVLNFGYTEQRREDRYMAQVSAEIVTKQGRYKAVTRDISVSGLCIELDDKIDHVNKQDKIGVALPGLQKRAGGLDLMDIPYVVTCVENGDKMLMHLKRILGEDSKQYGSFFKDLIDRNRGKLEIDLQDSMTAANARLYSMLAAESSATIPILLTRSVDREMVLKMALTETVCRFAEFFEVSPGRFDFSFMNVSVRLSRLMSGLRKEDRSELIVYLYKRFNEKSGRFDIYSLADFEIEDNSEKDEFLQTAMQHDYCIIKAIVGKACEPNELELNAIFDPLMERNSHIAMRLKTALASIVAIGDIVDVTRQMVEASGLAGSQPD